MPPPWGPPRTQENSRRLSSVGTTRVDCSRRAPDAGYRLAALEAASPPGQPVLEDSISDPPDQGGLAASAAGVFVSADSAGEVAGIDVLEPRRLADASGPMQEVWGGVVAVLHLVILV